MRLKELTKNLPDVPGVYFFLKTGEKVPLYIGKAASLKERVKSYFGKDLAEARGLHVVHMVDEATHIRITKTDSILEALLLEAELIKRWKPPYNSKEKDDKSFNYVAITDEEYPRVLLVRGKMLRDEGIEKYRKMFGPFPKGTELKIALGIIRKIFPWRDGKCAVLSGRPCFNRQIGLCPGTCTSEISKKDYARLIAHFSMLFSGKKKTLIRDLEKEMREYAKRKDFEKAACTRNQIFALKHIQDIALLQRDDAHRARGMRMEAYDIAHLSGTDVVGAMVVLEGGLLAKGEYRKFKIRGSRGNDDVNNLKEVLERRFVHKEWALPEAVIVDGGAGQVNVAKKILKKFGVRAFIIGVVKGKGHKAERFVGPIPYIKRMKDSIVMLNAEAHRFAVAYHKQKRNGAYRSFRA